HTAPLPARLSLCAARRKPKGPCATLRESADHHGAGRLLAWRGLDVRRLGRAAWFLPRGQSPVACAARALRRWLRVVDPARASPGAGDHVRRRRRRLGVLPLGGCRRYRSSSISSPEAATRYCRIATSATALLIAAIACTNFVVDPFGMYRLVDLEGFNAYKPAVDHRVRLVKAYDVRRLRPQGIILGTSRSHLGLRPSHDGWDPAAQPVYNLAFDGATTKEMYQYLLHAHTVRPLRQVVLGLDTYHATLAPATARPDFDANLLDSPVGGVLPSLIRADLKLLASLDTLRASLATVRSQSDREPQWFAPDGQRLGEVFFRRAGEHFEQLGPRGYFEEIDRLEVGFKREGQLAANA